MTFLVDGTAQSIEPSLDSLQTYLDVLKQEQKYVKTVLVNGQSVLLTDLYKGVYPLESTIEIQTYASLDELIEDTMNTASQYIPRLINVVGNTVHLLGAFKNAEAIECLQKGISVLEWHLAVLRNFASMAPNRETLVVEMYERTNSSYDLVKDAIENQDFIALHDVLAYELRLLLDAWNQSIAIFQQQMRLEHAKERLNYH